MEAPGAQQHRVAVPDRHPECPLRGDDVLSVHRTPGLQPVDPEDGGQIQEHAPGDEGAEVRDRAEAGARGIDDLARRAAVVEPPSVGDV